MILVSGATGLIGSHLVYTLVKQGHAVSALKRKGSSIQNTLEIFGFYETKPDAEFAKIKWIEGDVTDIFSLLDAMQGVEEVYHCAGLVSFDDKDRQQLLKINGEGTGNMINAALESGVKKFCHLSSIATLPNTDKQEVVDEGVYWKASPRNSWYAISKYSGEREAWRGAEEGLHVVIVNPAIVLGPGCWNRSSGQLISAARKGSWFYTGGSSAYVDVRDVVRCMIRLMEQNCFNQRYIVHAENMSHRTVLDMLHRGFKQNPPALRAGTFLLQTARISEGIISRFIGRPRRLNKALIRATTNRQTYSNQKIREATGISFVPISESIRHICLHYPKNV